MALTHYRRREERGRMGEVHLGVAGQRCSRLQEPEKHVDAYVEGIAGQTPEIGEING